MGIEIERKFLIVGSDWRQTAVGTTYRQGYIVADRERTVRVRRAGERGFLTIKGPGDGARRLEFEYEIPIAEADEMLATLCPGPLIEKIRYWVDYQGFTWEIDEFFGENRGLLLAEIELADEHQIFARPSWVGAEVTGDHRYYNACLARSPYANWKE
ncbi:CYTH domain-containing protein [Desulfofustis glycolicus]|uniref:Adenylate cyclase n=1 Tax=Desulfofustis glycolicus DSM 9705 TaxID=1121409 RepID=A0A1M5T4G5_9BACT|nr:CYTH domain-containing protein [Desulfofustis glycolicus]SHH45635.1 adenylate cyclase [Desulfofustis glycolicus DSM 9705]